MAALKLRFTNAGLAAVQGASGSDPVTISHLGLTATPFDYAPTLTALPGEFKRLDIASGVAAAPNITHLTAYDTSADAWSITGFGLFMDNGVLFAVYTGPDILMSKAALAFAMFAYDIAFDADLAAVIEFADATFIWPPATQQTRGIARIATQARVSASVDGDDDAETIVTPKTLRARLTALLATVAASIDALGTALTAALNGEANNRAAGDAALQDQVNGRLLASSYNPADVLAKLITVDGAGSALDADLLDGHHGSDYDRITDRQLIENNGYEVYASGKKETWGSFSIAENQTAIYVLPVPHTAWVHPVLGISSETGNTNIQDNTGITGIVRDVNGLPTGVRIWNADDRTVTVWIRTKGV